MNSEKVAVIVGGTSGIGECTARELIRFGYRVVVGGRRARTEMVRSSADGHQSDVENRLISLFLDLSDRLSVRDFFRFVDSQFGRLDLLVFSAGIMKLSPISDCKLDEWEEMFAINVFGLLRSLAASLPLFVKGGGGKVINIGSVAGHKVATPDGTVYSATKFAVAALSEGMRQELAQMNVSVTLVSPGATKTQLGQNSSNRESKYRISDYYAKYGMEAEDVARQIAEIAVSESTANVSEIVLRSLHHRF